jgi:hypothetical protein
LRHMGRSDLIGSGRQQLIPAYQPPGTGERSEGRRAPFRTQHTGLPHTPPPRGKAPPRGKPPARGKSSRKTG